MITEIEGRKYGFEVLEFQSNTSIGVISIKNLCNHIASDSEEYPGKRS